jgi:effector-binding domain-containing protein
MGRRLVEDHGKAHDFAVTHAEAARHDELAITVHVGNDSDIDRDYDCLATYVADHALAVEGPIREYDVVGPNETPDESLSRTEIGWPIFHIGGTPGA